MFAGGLPVLAQTGSLEVTLLDAGTQQPLPGATVVLSNPLGLIAPTAEVSDTDGQVEFPVLRAGREYVLEVSMPGFATQRHPEIRVRGSQPTKLVVQLAPEMEERVEVSAREDVVALDKTGGSTRFNDEFFENLPVLGRFYQNVLTLAPGVNDADQDGNPNVHGARSRNFQGQVSGVSNVDPLTGKWLSYVNYDSIEEIEVLTWGAGAEFGRAQGGFARILQKQGSNEFEGVFSFLYRSSKFDGDGATTGVGVEVPDFDSYQPAIQLTGPIVRDKLWFRLSHEYIDREDPVNVINDVGVITREQGIHSDQITWQVSPRNKLAFFIQNDPLRIENFDLSSTVPAEASRTFERGGPTYGVSWVAPVSAQIIVDSLVSYQDSETEVRPTVEGVNQKCIDFVRYPGLNDARCFNQTKGFNSGSYPDTFEDSRQRFTVRSDATVYVRRALGASHQLKLGFSVENERYFRHLERRPDMLVEEFYPLFPPPFVIGRAKITVPVPTASADEATGNTWGVYFEDQIKPTSNLSLRVGLRYDREEIRAVGRESFDPAAEAAAFFERYHPDLHPLQVNGIARDVFTAYENIGEFQQEFAATMGVHRSLVPLNNVAVESTFWPRARRDEGIGIVNDNVSPRLAVSWDPWSNGKTKLSATWGRYYDKIFLAVPLIEVEPSTTSFSITGEPAIWFERDKISYVGTLPALDATVTTRVVDHDLRTPFQDEFSLSFERALWTESSIKISYLNRKFRDQLQDVDVNHEDGVVLNPGWGEILVIGNFNTAEYTSYVVELVRRLYRGWELNTSYTWSESVGDAEDFDQLLGNNRSQADAERSYLSFDQRHVVRVNAMTVALAGLRLGGTIRWESGLPFSIMRTSPVRYRMPQAYATLGVSGEQFNFAFPTDQRNDQRNESFWNFDARIAWELSLARDVNLQLTAEVFNLLDDDSLIKTNTIDGNFAGTRRFGRQYQLGIRLAF
jgi:outer membrane receptor for ferrienterochelin and colicin